jgi:hypothetical protein
VNRVVQTSGDLWDDECQLHRFHWNHQSRYSQIVGTVHTHPRAPFRSCPSMLPGTQQNP